jgi:hypothetical protein
MTALLTTLVEESAAPLACVESQFAADSTGFGTVTYRRWYDAKYGREMKAHGWIKAHAMVGVNTNVITAIRVTGSDRLSHNLRAVRRRLDGLDELDGPLVLALHPPRLVVGARAGRGQHVDDVVAGVLRLGRDRPRGPLYLADPPVVRERPALLLSCIHRITSVATLRAHVKRVDMELRRIHNGPHGNQGDQGSKAERRDAGRLDAPSMQGERKGSVDAGGRARRAGPEWVAAALGQHCRQQSGAGLSLSRATSCPVRASSIAGKCLGITTFSRGMRRGVGRTSRGGR